MKIPREAAVSRKVLLKMNQTLATIGSDGLLASLAFRRRSGCSATLLSYCVAMKNYFRNEVANLPKIVNGPKGNKTSKTAASVEMLNGIENPTVLDYARNFGNAAKDGLNRTTHWAVYYFTNPNSWYPVLERAVILSAIRAIQPLPPLQVTVQSVQKMSD